MTIARDIICFVCLHLRVLKRYSASSLVHTVCTYSTCHFHDDSSLLASRDSKVPIGNTLQTLSRNGPSKYFASTVCLLYSVEVSIFQL